MRIALLQLEGMSVIVVDALESAPQSTSGSAGIVVENDSIASRHRSMTPGQFITTVRIARVALCRSKERYGEHEDCYSEYGSVCDSVLI